MRLNSYRLGIGLTVAAVSALAAVFSLADRETAIAGQAQDEGGTQGVMPEISVYATGLDNPRGLDFDAEGNLWVAESGRGADEIGPDTPMVPMENAEEGEENGEDGQQEGQGSENGEEPEALFIGNTGAFTMIVDGEPERVFDGLPSVASESGAEAIGPADISFHSDGTARTVIGLGASPDDRDDLAPDSIFGYLQVIDANGDVVGEFDVAAFEGEFNIDNGEIDTNPNGVLAANDGGSFVTDAGANALLFVDSEGNVSASSVFVPRLTATPEFLPQPPFPPEIPMQSVPTAVAFGPDGALYISELTGFPFAEGEAKIWRVVPGEPATEFLTGFTNIIDLQFDSEGNLYVLEIDSTGFLSPDEGDGALWFISADDLTMDNMNGADDDANGIDDGTDDNATDDDGTSTRNTEARLIVGGETLSFPGGMTIGPDGAIYVTNNGVMAEEGEVLRIEVAVDDSNSGNGNSES